jgi:hypothetical protein
MWDLVFRGYRADGEVALVADIRCWCAGQDPEWQ